MAFLTPRRMSEFFRSGLIDINRSACVRQIIRPEGPSRMSITSVPRKNR